MASDEVDALMERIRKSRAAQQLQSTDLGLSSPFASPCVAARGGRQLISPRDNYISLTPPALGGGVIGGGDAYTPIVISPLSSRVRHASLSLELLRERSPSLNLYEGYSVRRQSENCVLGNKLTAIPVHQPDGVPITADLIKETKLGETLFLVDNRNVVFELGPVAQQRQQHLKISNISSRQVKVSAELFIPQAYEGVRPSSPCPSSHPIFRLGDATSSGASFRVGNSAIELGPKEEKNLVIFFNAPGNCFCFPPQSWFPFFFLKMNDSCTSAQGHWAVLRLSGLDSSIIVHLQGFCAPVEVLVSAQNLRLPDIINGGHQQQTFTITNKSNFSIFLRARLLTSGPKENRHWSLICEDAVFVSSRFNNYWLSLRLTASETKTLTLRYTLKDVVEETMPNVQLMTPVECKVEFLCQQQQDEEEEDDSNDSSSSPLAELRAQIDLLRFDMTSSLKVLRVLAKENDGLSSEWIPVRYRGTKRLVSLQSEARPCSELGRLMNSKGWEVWAEPGRVDLSNGHEVALRMRASYCASSSRSKTTPAIEDNDPTLIIGSHILGLYLIAPPREGRSSTCDKRSAAAFTIPAILTPPLPEKALEICSPDSRIVVMGRLSPHYKDDWTRRKCSVANVSFATLKLKACVYFKRDHKQNILGYSCSLNKSSNSGKHVSLTLAAQESVDLFISIRVNQPIAIPVLIEGFVIFLWKYAVDANVLLHSSNANPENWKLSHLPLAIYSSSQELSIATADDQDSFLCHDLGEISGSNNSTTPPCQLILRQLNSSCGVTSRVSAIELLPSVDLRPQIAVIPSNCSGTQVVRVFTDQDFPWNDGDDEKHASSSSKYCIYTFLTVLQEGDAELFSSLASSNWKLRKVWEDHIHLHPLFVTGLVPSFSTRRYQFQSTRNVRLGPCFTLTTTSEVLSSCDRIGSMSFLFASSLSKKIQLYSPFRSTPALLSIKPLCVPHLSYARDIRNWGKWNKSIPLNSETLQLHMDSSFSPFLFSKHSQPIPTGGKGMDLHIHVSPPPIVPDLPSANENERAPPFVLLSQYFVLRYETNNNCQGDDAENCMSDLLGVHALLVPASLVRCLTKTEQHDFIYG